MTKEQILEKACTSAALDKISNRSGKAAYPPEWETKVPLIVTMLKTVKPDMPFLCAEDTICKEGEQYYVWVNSYGAVSAILENGEQLGLKPDEFSVFMWHEKPGSL